jgi:radical SAM superfamily enzyme YgiQ (UPF0313 family)
MTPLKICFVIYRYLFASGETSRYPLGPMYISAVLKRKGHDVKALNYNVQPNYDFEREICDQDAVLFTGYREFLPYIKRDAAIARKMGKKTIVGGGLATFEPDEMLKHVDTVVIGEGELVIEEALHSTGKILGLAPDLDRLPYPDWKTFGVERHMKERPYLSVLTSRGCPFRCSYCNQTCAFKERSMKAVFKELDVLYKKYKPGLISFADNTLNLTKERFMALCEGMAARGPVWTGAIRAIPFDAEMAQAARESKCLHLCVGVESLRQDKLDRMKKRIKADDFLRIFALLEEYRVPFGGNILVGFEGETLEDIASELAELPQRYWLHPRIVEPYPGTTDGAKRGISEETARALANHFNLYADSRERFRLPDLE